MLSNLNTVKEYVPNSYEDAGGNRIKESAYNNVMEELKQQGKLFSPEQQNYLSQQRQYYSNQIRENKLPRDQARQLYQKDYQSSLEKSINLPFYKAKEKTGWSGQYFPSKHEIVYTHKSPSVSIHELTHSLSLYPRTDFNDRSYLPRYEKPQNKAIKSRLRVRNDAENISKQPYWDNPEEVYSRLMQIRHDADLKPDQTIDSQMLNKIRKRVSPLLNQTFMNRYTDDSLLKLFNEVAYSNNRNYEIS